MTLALWCVLISGLMPIVWTGVAKVKGQRFNNRNPRRWQAGLEGLPARAHAAHLNAFEAFPLFAAAVVAAHAVLGQNGVIDALALAYVVARIGYGLAYLADTHLLRSAVWLAALLLNLAIFGAIALLPATG